MPNPTYILFFLNGFLGSAKKKELKDAEIYYDVIPYGNVLIAYVQGGVCFYDITNPLDPVLLSKLQG